MTSAGSDEPRPEPGRDRDGHLDERLAELVSGELGTTSRDRVLAHLATCEKCKAEAEAQRRLKNDLATAMLSFPNRLEDQNQDDGGHHFAHPQEQAVSAEPRREPRAESWTSLAARIAGERRDMRTAWLADLEGRPEDGAPLTAWQQRRYALGFLVAAVRLFLRDAFGRLWGPCDWLLSTRNRREAFIGLPPALLVLYIAKHDGVHTLLTEGWGWIGGCGAAMFAVVRWLQRVRGIELAEGSSTNGD
ncbi:anti-sigma factor family protein [Streptomyces sp. NBC_00151]|uniref:anti-sigma factor family protein n=1 Tax=Streptomyces sp. NBC_00151 TaxID=2975669 RepID=UPI003FA3C8E9